MADPWANDAIVKPAQPTGGTSQPWNDDPIVKTRPAPGIQRVPAAQQAAAPPVKPKPSIADQAGAYGQSIVDTAVGWSRDAGHDMLESAFRYQRHPEQAERFKHMGLPQRIAEAAGKTGADIGRAGNMLGAPVGGALHAGVSAPVEKATGIPAQYTDYAMMAAPLVGEIGRAVRPLPRVGLPRGGAPEAPKAPRRATGGPAEPWKADPVVEPPKVGKTRLRPPHDPELDAPRPVAEPWKADKVVKGPVRPPEEPGRIYERGGAEKKIATTAERVDDNLNRLKTGATADKLEFQEYLRDRVPPELADPKVQEELHHAIEAKLIDPAAEIPEHLRPAYEAIKPYYEEQTQLINAIRKRRGGEEIVPYEAEQGYVHRIAQGKGHLFDAADTEGMGAHDPITGKGKSFAKSTSSLKSRKFVVLEDRKGGRTFVPDAEGDDYKVGSTIKGSFGKSFKVRQATTAEIEANTDVRYYKNALLSTVDNVARLRRVSRNLDMLDNLVDDMKERGLAHKFEWKYKDPEDGRLRLGENRDTPKGFRETSIPQLRGVAFDKGIADTLEDFYGKSKGDLVEGLTKLNRLLASSLFITPVPHALNVMGHWIVGRGFDWVNPFAYARAARTGVKAVRDVITGGEDYRRMLREGSGLMYGDTATDNFHKVLIEKLAQEAGDPALDPVARSMGLRDAAHMVKAMHDAVYKASNRMLWAANDVFLLARQYELMEKGMSARDAIRESERDIPNYRIPPQVMGQRWLSEGLKSPNIILFGRYKYGMFRAYAGMVKDLVKGTGEQRVEAVGKLLVMLAMATVGLPFATSVVRHATGNNDVKVRAFGPWTIPMAIADWTQGQRDFATMLSAAITPAPATETPVELLRNRDFFGQPIHDDEGSELGQGVELGEYAAGKYYPAQLGLDALKHRDDPGLAAAREGGKMVGLDFPPPDKDAKREKAKHYQKKRAMRREAKDPILSAIRDDE